jgi:S1-C subfamily serine protease
MRRFSFSLAATALGLALAGAARANPEAYERALRSTAWVLSPINEPEPEKRPAPSDLPPGKPASKGAQFSRAEKGTRVSSGSGVLVDARRRLVLTNFHVVEKRPTAILFFPQTRADEVVTDPEVYFDNLNRVAVRGRVLVSDPERDLAVIQLERLPAGARALPISRRAPSPGEAIHAVGNSGVQFVAGKPQGTLWRYSKGEVRQVYRKKFKTGNGKGLEFEVNARVVESQIPSNQGDSGGPVVNDRGELVAVTQSGSNSQQLVSFAIDVAEARAVLANLGTGTADTEVRPVRRPRPVLDDETEDAAPRPVIDPRDRPPARRAPWPAERFGPGCHAPSGYFRSYGPPAGYTGCR